MAQIPAINANAAAIVHPALVSVRAAARVSMPPIAFLAQGGAPVAATLAAVVPAPSLIARGGASITTRLSAPLFASTLVSRGEIATLSVDE